MALTRQATKKAVSNAAVNSSISGIAGRQNYTIKAIRAKVRSL
jgi:hypothetical protein